MARSTVAVKFTGDTADLKRSLSGIDGQLKSTGSKLASFGKMAAIGLGGLAVGAVALGKGFVDAAIESQKVAKQTEAVIASMGGAAGVTAKQVGDLAGAISLKTGVDDELIQTGANVLLTFGKIRNAVGDGNDIFDQATKAALDMSVALGTDMKSASMLVGKALNDPIRGLAALRRTGIQFTKQQEDQIKAMVEVGDIAGAQKQILGELSKQFGGSAEAQATATDKLKVAWGNLQETLGEKLLPIVERVTGWLAENLPGAIAATERAFERAKPFVKDVADAVRDFVDKALVVMKAWWDDNGETVVAAAEALATGVKEAFDALIEAGGFVVEHWDQFKFAAAAMAAAIVAHYVRLGVAAVASAATQAGAWVSMKAAALLSKIETAAIIVLYIAEWVKLAAAAVINAAIVVASWVATQVAARGATTAHGVAVAAQIVGWGALARAAIAQAGSIALAWTRALGPIAAVVAAAEAANNLIGSHPNDPAKGNSLWDNLTRNPFDGMDIGFDLTPGFDVPWGNANGTPGWRGGMSWVGERGPELVDLPQGAQVYSHTRSMQMATAGGGGGAQVIQLVVDGKVLAEAVADANGVRNRNRGR